MPKFTFTGDYDEPFCRSTLQFDAEFIQDVIANFEMFLRGVGYHFDGHLEIVDERLDSYEDEMDPGKRPEMG